jgi:hypothetical protein
MTPAAVSPWARNWTIVRSDLDIAHVMLPLSNFRLESVPGTTDSPAYRLVHNNQAPVPDCFCGSVLGQLGQDQPSFFEVTNMKPLPAYNQDSAAQYVKVSDLMNAYLARNPQVQRLEGIIKIPCHAHGSQLTEGALEGHAPLTVKTMVLLYQFANAIAGDNGESLPLLVVRTPLSPVCPINSDGTALGVGKN